MDLNFILGGAELPAAVPLAPDGIRTEDLDRRLAVLASLAPGLSYKNYDTVRNRLGRTRVSRDELERSLEAGKLLKLQEYDREAAARHIDEQYIALRCLRNTIETADRRKR